MVTLEGKLRVPVAALEATRMALIEHVDLTRAEMGCLAFDVTCDPAEPQNFLVNAAFIDAQALAAHQARITSSAWGKLTKDFERDYEVQGLDAPASDDEIFMAQALRLADTGAASNEVPVGAVIVSESKIIGRGFNRPISSNDPTAHAELVALRQAAATLGNYRLPSSVLYVTIEPCVMCVGALVHARVGRVVFGAREPKAGALVSHPLFDRQPSNHRFEISEGVLAGPCGRRMTDFFAVKRSTKVSA